MLTQHAGASRETHISQQQNFRGKTLGTHIKSRAVLGRRPGKDPRLPSCRDRPTTTTHDYLIVICSGAPTSGRWTNPGASPTRSHIHGERNVFRCWKLDVYWLSSGRRRDQRTRSSVFEPNTMGRTNWCTWTHLPALAFRTYPCEPKAVGSSGGDGDS